MQQLQDELPFPHSHMIPRPSGDFSKAEDACGSTPTISNQGPNGPNAAARRPAKGKRNKTKWGAMEKPAADATDVERGRFPSGGLVTLRVTPARLLGPPCNFLFVLLLGWLELRTDS